MSEIHAFQRNDSRGAFFVLGEGETRDDLQVTGRWLATDAPVEVCQ